MHRHRLKRRLWSTQARFREGQQFIHQFAHFTHLILYASKALMHFHGCALLHHGEPHLHAHQRRTKFVRDVAQEAFLSAHESCEPGRHQMDGVAQAAKFIASPRIDWHVEIALGNLLCGAGKLRNGTSQAAHQWQPEQRREKQQPPSPVHPGAQVKQQPVFGKRINASHQRHRHGITPRHGIALWCRQNRRTHQQPISARGIGSHQLQRKGPPRRITPLLGWVPQRTTKGPASRPALRGESTGQRIGEHLIQGFAPWRRPSQWGLAFSLGQHVLDQHIQHMGGWLQIRPGDMFPFVRIHGQSKVVSAAEALQHVVMIFRGGVLQLCGQDLRH